jgi:hypothetical protein
VISCLVQLKQQRLLVYLFPQKSQVWMLTLPGFCFFQQATTQRGFRQISERAHPAEKQQDILRKGRDTFGIVVFT